MIELSIKERKYSGKELHELLRIPAGEQLRNIFYNDGELTVKTVVLPESFREEKVE